MKFYNYLKEDTELDFLAFQKMAEECKPFLKELKRSNFEFLYSGRKNNYENFEKKKIRKDRKPKDMPEIIHNLLDKKFEKNFGVKARSQGFFISNNPSELFEYGTPHYVFPVGNYKLIYSKIIKDLYRNLQDKTERNDIEMDYFASIFGGSSGTDVKIGGYTKEEWLEEMEKIINRILETYEQSKKIPTSLPAGYEMILITNEVRLLEWDINDRHNVVPLLKEWINNIV